MEKVGRVIIKNNENDENFHKQLNWKKILSHLFHQELLSIFCILGPGESN